MGDAEIDHLRVPAELFGQAVTLLFHGLIHVSSCFHPQTSVLQLSCASADLRRAARATDRLCRLEQQFLKHLQVLGPFTLRFFAILPIGEN